jgi:NAD(P)-dependent dehydrogenase (short-subunit alcohol dehydrogenase family)
VSSACQWLRARERNDGIEFRGAPGGPRKRLRLGFESPSLRALTRSYLVTLAWSLAPPVARASHLAPSSLGGLVVGPERGIYHAAKHGVLGLTKSAALEYAARGIRINAICPGMIHTPMSDRMVTAGQGEALKEMEKSIPMKRQGRPEEIANAVLWLCSDAASYVTGQSISVDGGFIMR